MMLKRSKGERDGLAATAWNDAGAASILINDPVRLLNAYPFIETRAGSMGNQAPLQASSVMHAVRRLAAAKLALNPVCLVA